MKPRGWALAGGLIGALMALVGFAPAAWLARTVAAQTDGQLVLADARGTVWTGSARLLLTGGADSRDAAVLPGRLHWQLRPRGLGLELQARHACCLSGTVTVGLQPGIGRFVLTVPAGTPPAADAAGSPPGASSAAAATVIGRWPLDWLAGLGTPWNTLQLDGQAQLSTSSGLRLETVQGRWRLAGGAALELRDVASRVSRLAPLGSYRLTLQGGGDGDAPALLQLVTLDGALQLDAAGQWAATGLRLRGEARAAPGTEAALDNLLNIIGRRNGARSVLSIG